MDIPLELKIKKLVKVDKENSTTPKALINVGDYQYAYSIYYLKPFNFPLFTVNLSG
jgi:hypothetical protein